MPEGLQVFNELGREIVGPNDALGRILHFWGRPAPLSSSVAAPNWGTKFVTAKPFGTNSTAYWWQKMDGWYSLDYSYSNGRLSYRITLSDIAPTNAQFLVIAGLY